MRLEALRERARLLDCVRRFFAERDVLEVTTPVLSQAGNTDPNIESFVTRYTGRTDAPPPRWLRTSPEFFLKRLLAAGSGDIFEVASVFRNGECGQRHNPEFTLLEWYRVGWTHHQLMDEVEALVRTAAQAFGRALGPLQRQSYAQCYQSMLGLDPHRAPLAALQAPLSAYAIDPDGLTRDDWLDLLRTHCIEPQLDASGGCFLYDFPASQAALARVRAGDPPVAERFELYLGSVELANGYHELCDPVEQRQRFERDLQQRRARGSAEPAIDEHLLQALAQMPACAGVALGIDRLHQWLVGASRLDQVLCFPFGVA